MAAGTSQRLFNGERYAALGVGRPQWLALAYAGSRHTGSLARWLAGRWRALAGSSRAEAPRRSVPLATARCSAGSRRYRIVRLPWAAMGCAALRCAAWLLITQPSLSVCSCRPSPCQPIPFHPIPSHPIPAPLGW